PLYPAPRRSAPRYRGLRAGLRSKVRRPWSGHPVIVEMSRRALSLGRADEQRAVQPLMRPLRNFEARRDTAIGVARRYAFTCLDPRKHIGARIGDAPVVNVDRRSVIRFHEIMRLELHQSAVPDLRPVPSGVWDDAP